MGTPFIGIDVYDGTSLDLGVRLQLENPLSRDGSVRAWAGGSYEHLEQRSSGLRQGFIKVAAGIGVHVARRVDIGGQVLWVVSEYRNYADPHGPSQLMAGFFPIFSLQVVVHAGPLDEDRAVVRCARER